MPLIQNMVVVGETTILFGEFLDGGAREDGRGTGRKYPFVAEETRCAPGGAVVCRARRFGSRVALAPHLHQFLTFLPYSSLLFHLQHELSRQRRTYRLRRRTGHRPQRRGGSGLEWRGSRGCGWRRQREKELLRHSQHRLQVGSKFCGCFDVYGGLTVLCVF